MNYYTMWTGSYEFKSELRQILESFKSYLEFVLNKINETDRMLDSSK